ncbi:MAG: hypothetical protein C4519_04350 [Desulfobacteraceae bacterium]|nr:MAG: hypothetical protein C4519_04350 [Desulfobacteraceae bacterium]
MVTIKKKVGPVGQFIGAIVFVVAGLGVIYLLGSDTSLICNRGENRCVIQEKNIFKGTQITTAMNLNDIQGAEVAEGKDSKGNPIYHMMLATNQIRLHFSSGKYASCNKTASRINQYLQSTENDLKVTDSGTVPRVFGFVFAGAGFFLLLHSLSKLLKLLLKLAFVLVQR